MLKKKKSNYAERRLGRIQLLSLVKTLSQLGTGGVGPHPTGLRGLHWASLRPKREPRVSNRGPVVE